jgi:3-oxoacyl-[acyl-carrier protein] reductase
MGTSTLLRADLGSDREVDAMFETVAAIGGCDVLVNNAGSYPTRPLLDMTTDDWSAVLRDNATTTFSCTRSAARTMIERGRGGSIINIASLSATHPAPEQSHYNSSKAAVVTLTMSAAQELGPHGIRVNAVSPGLIERPDIEREWPDGVRRWRSRAPLGRLGHPLDVADACLFLASPLSSWITGQNLVVDGGVSAAPAY